MYCVGRLNPRRRMDFEPRASGGDRFRLGHYHVGRFSDRSDSDPAGHLQFRYGECNRYRYFPVNCDAADRCRDPGNLPDDSRASGVLAVS